MELEARVRVAVRDAVNRPSRKPFYWGGLKGYEQLQAIARVLGSVSPNEPETSYLRRLAMQVDRAVDRNRVLAEDLREAHTWLRRIAECLRYPPASFPLSDPSDAPLTSEPVTREMEELLQAFQPDLKRRPAQAALHDAWHRVWEDCGPEWLHCYDIPGLPPDNLALESLFGRLRCHQRRVSGRKSTHELRDFGHCQVLFLAETEEDLLLQLRQVPLAQYQNCRRRLAEAEAPRQLLHRLHRDPPGTIRGLIAQHAARRAELGSSNTSLPEADNHATEAQEARRSGRYDQKSPQNGVTSPRRSLSAPSVGTVSGRGLSYLFHTELFNSDAGTSPLPPTSDN